MMHGFLSDREARLVAVDLGGRMAKPSREVRLGRGAIDRMVSGEERRKRFT